MEMSHETPAYPDKDRKYQRPGERAVRFILGILGFFRDMFTSPSTIIPRGRVLRHRGHDLPAGKAIRYSHILLVEDNPDTAREFIETIENYYVFGSIIIFVAHAFDAALTFFANEEVNQKFLGERPGITILANSSRKISNLKLTGFGAVETLGKKTEKLKMWLAVNDPTGSEG